MQSDDQIREKLIEIGAKSGTKPLTSIDARKAFLGGSQPAAANKIVQIFNQLQVHSLFTHSLCYIFTRFIYFIAYLIVIIIGSWFDK